MNQTSNNTVVPPMPKDSDLKSIGLCTALYDTDLFIDTTKDNYGDEQTYQAASFAALSLILVGLLYYWLQSRTRLLGKV